MRTPKVRMAVIGGGRMARALGRILSARSADVHLFARRPKTRQQLSADLPGVQVDDALATAVEGAQTIFFAVPADSLSEAADAYGPMARGDHVVLTACRGVGSSFELPHELIRAKTCVRKIGIIGGPIHARELASGRRINAVVASRYGEVIEATRGLTAGAPITIHPSRDIIGVQVAGAIGNVSSIAAGMADAIDLSETAKGLLRAHGLVDAKRLGIHLGAEERTFLGLAGVGELLPRNVTSMDRHVAFGGRIAAGEDLDRALTAVDGPVEGVVTVRAASAVAKARSIELPLVRAVQAVLTGQATANDALEDVLHRSLELA